MKKMKVLIVLLSFIGFSCVNSAFNRDRFQEVMYKKSGGMLPVEEYNKIVNPVFDQAEGQLKAVQFCKQNDSEQCEYYFSLLLDYNVACFKSYAQPNELTDSLLKRKERSLGNSIQALARKGALQQNEIEIELSNTQKLFLDGNKKFYDALPLHIKLSFWLSK